MRTSRTSVLLVGAGLALSPLTAAAKLWINPSGGVFSASGNWEPLGAPVTVDDATFKLGGAYSLKFSVVSTTNRMVVGGDQLELRLNQNTYTLATTSSSKPGLILGLLNGDAARLGVYGGTVKSAGAVAGFGSHSSGSITIGASGTLITSKNLVVGNTSGEGNLTLAFGGHGYSGSALVGYKAGSSGSATVSGSSTSWAISNDLFVGGAGSGDVTVGGKAALRIGDALAMGNGGSVTVNGGILTFGRAIDNSAAAAPSRPRSAPVNRINFVSGGINITKSDFSVGSGGLFGANLSLNSNQALNAYLSAIVDAGASVTVKNGRLNAGEFINHGTISLAGTAFDPAGPFLLGGVENGKLAEGHVSNEGTLVGKGQIKTDVDNLGIVRSTGRLVIYGNLNNTGNVTIKGALADVWGDVANNGQSFWVGPASTMSFHGRVDGGSGFSGGGKLVFDGNYNPISAGQAIVIGGNVEFSGEGLLTLDVGAHADLLDISGYAALNDVNVRIDPDFVPELGHVYPLLTADSITRGGGVTFSGGGAYTPEIVQTAQSLGVRFSESPVPEPGLLLAVPVLGLLLRRRRTR